MSLRLIEYRVSQTQKRDAPDPAEPEGETPWGTLVSLGPPDPEMPHGVEVSIVLRYGDEVAPFVQDFIEQIEKLGQMLRKKAHEKD